MPNLYVWDFHGVLEKGNEYAVRDISQAVLENHGYYRKVTLDEVLYLYGNTWTVYFRTLVPSLSEGMVKQMAEEAIDLTWKTMKTYIRPMDYAMDVLLLLKLKGHTNVVLSNTGQARIGAFVESVGLVPFISKIIGTDDQENPVGRKAEEIRKLSAGYDNIFMIGDAETDVEAGLAAGVTTVLFNPRKRSVDTKAHRTITDLREMLRI